MMCRNVPTREHGRSLAPCRKNGVMGGRLGEDRPPRDRMFYAVSKCLIGSIWEGTFSAGAWPTCGQSGAFHADCALVREPARTWHGQTWNPADQADHAGANGGEPKFC